MSQYTLQVDLGDRSYPIHIGAGLLGRPELFEPHVAGKTVMICTNTTVGLTCRDRLSMIYVENCRPAEVTTLRMDAGVRLPLATTAAGRAYLAATPEQVGRLAQAQASGRLVMSLVGNGDEGSNAPIQVNMKDITGTVEAAPEAAPVQEKTCTIRQRNGGVVTEIPIPCTN